MKNLLFKEFKLAVHPIVYIFVLVFPLMVFIPSYPLFIPLIYVACSYPILFLGSNKGQSSNDIFYSQLLPVRKKDVILARLLTVAIIQVVPMLIMLCLSPFINSTSQIDYKIMLETGQELTMSGLDKNGLISMFALSLFSFNIYDGIFFPMFYKTGRAVILPTLVAMFLFMGLNTITLTVLPLVSTAYMDLFNYSPIGIQLLFLLGSIIIYLICHYFIYKKTVKVFEKVDF